MESKQVEARHTLKSGNLIFIHCAHQIGQIIEIINQIFHLYEKKITKNRLPIGQIKLKAVEI
jgi:hypothetical protein